MSKTCKILSKLHKIVHNAYHQGGCKCWFPCRALWLVFYNKTKTKIKVRDVKIFEFSLIWINNKLRGAYFYCTLMVCRRWETKSSLWPISTPFTPIIVARGNFSLPQWFWSNYFFLNPHHLSLSFICSNLELWILLFYFSFQNLSILWVEQCCIWFYCQLLMFYYFKYKYKNNYKYE
jgi:hypothetical protein